MSRECYWFSNGDEGGDFVWVSDEDLAEARDRFMSDGNRCEWADDFEGKPIPADLMLENDFCMACDHCGRMLIADGYWDDDETVVVTSGPWVWCNQSCRDEWQAWIDRKRAYRLSVEARYPFATSVSAYNGSPGKCECFRADRDNLAADIYFPGGKYAAQACNGCGNLWVSNCDVEQWRLMAAQQRAVPQGAD